MFNALRALFLDDTAKLYHDAGFLEEDMSALTKRGVRAMWSILIKEHETALKALAHDAIASDKADNTD